MAFNAKIVLRHSLLLYAFDRKTLHSPQPAAYILVRRAHCIALHSRLCIYVRLVVISTFVMELLWAGMNVVH